MNLDSSRRIFLRIIPGAIAGLWALKAFGHEAPAGQATSGSTSPPPSKTNGGGSGGGGGLPKPPSSQATDDGSLAPASDSTKALPPTQNSHVHAEVPPAPKADPKLLKENQTGIKTNVTKLAELAQELKKQVEETDATKVLSLDLIKKSQEIEKLAHQIATLAKG
jgi:hypothetical protein